MNLEVYHNPIFLGGLFKATHDSPLPRGSLEYDYMARNLERTSKSLGLTFKFTHDRFPVNSLRSLRGFYFARSVGKEREYLAEIFASCWSRDEDISQVEVLADILKKVNISPDDFVSFIDKEDTKKKLRDDTQLAFERGVFGVPTIFLNGEMYWGTPGEILWNLEHAEKRLEC
jgi:2-hydroxychromene-2-carboxylate isomerase